MTLSSSDLESLETAGPGQVPETVDDTRTDIEGRSLGQIAWRRFRRDKVAMTSLVISALVILLGIAAPFLSIFGVIDASTQHQDLVQGIGSLPTGPFGGASLSHPLGVVPGTGYDLMSRLILGLPLDLIIAIAGALVTVILGTILGMVAGYFGRWVDTLIGRIIDLVLAFPQLIMLIALSVVLIQIVTDAGVPGQNPPRIVYLIFVLGFFGWPGFARVIRSQVLSLREREFVDAARSIGAKPRRIIFREILPNLWATILVYGTSVLPAYVSTEAALAFLGIGVVPPTPTIGNILSDSVNYAISDPPYFFLPGIVLVIVVLAFNLLGDGLRDALDPKADRT